jgi:hypothetical protein
MTAAIMSGKRVSTLLLSGMLPPGPPVFYSEDLTIEALDELSVEVLDELTVVVCTED